MGEGTGRVDGTGEDQSTDPCDSATDRGLERASRSHRPVSRAVRDSKPRPGRETPRWGSRESHPEYVGVKLSRSLVFRTQSPVDWGIQWTGSTFLCDVPGSYQPFAHTHTRECGHTILRSLFLVGSLHPQPTLHLHTRHGSPGRTPTHPHSPPDSFSEEWALTHPHDKEHMK